MGDADRELLQRTISVDEATVVLKQADTVAVAWGYGTPDTLTRRLARDSLRVPTFTGGGLHPNGFESLVPTVQPGLFPDPSDYIPTAMAIGAGVDTISEGGHLAFVVRLSPPDKSGFCSLGPSIWNSSVLAANATTIVGQIDASVPTIFGDTRIHVRDVHWFVEGASNDRLDHILENHAAEGSNHHQEISGHEAAIGEQLEALVRDGDTLFPSGELPGRLLGCLRQRTGLSIHCNLAPSSALDLLGSGSLDGSRRTMHTGVALTATALALRSADDLQFVDRHPLIQLFGVEHTSHPSTISAHDNLVAISAPVAIDLMGQASFESAGDDRSHGAGGAESASIAALLSRGGRSIQVLHSFIRSPSGEKWSTIVPLLSPETLVSVPRTFADWVVTEHGAVNLQGRSLRERADALIALADPDFRTELRRNAHELWYR